MTKQEELLQHLSIVMKRLSDAKITIEEAKAQANLVKQSNNLLRYDLDERKFQEKLLETHKTQ